MMRDRADYSGRPI